MSDPPHTHSANSYERGEFYNSKKVRKRNIIIARNLRWSGLVGVRVQVIVCTCWPTSNTRETA